MMVMLPGTGGADANRPNAALVSIEPPQLIEFTNTEQRIHTTAATAKAHATRDTLAALRKDDSVVSLQLGHASPQHVLATRSFELRPAPDQSALRVEGLRHEREGGLDHLYQFDWKGKIETSLVVDSPDVLGWIRTPTKTWTLIPLGDGVTAISEHDPSRTAEHRHHNVEAIGHGHPEAQPEVPDPLSTARRAIAAQEIRETTIDVLVMYTRAAKIRSGSTAGSMRMLLAQAFANTNRIFENSGLETRLRLVHAEETPYVESPQGTGVDMCYLASNGATGDGSCGDPPHTPTALDEVWALREEHQVDLIVLISDPLTGAVGKALGFVGGESMPFSIVAGWAQQNGNHTLAHEIGHNLGAGHNPGYSTSDGYAHGRCNTDENWRTVMSYRDDGPPDHNHCTWRIPLFAGPNVIGPYGTPTGDTHTHDVVRRFTETTPIVAAYRMASSAETTRHLVPFIPRTDAANGLHGFIRIINRSTIGGTIAITATDDAGGQRETLMELGPSTTAHFSSRDLAGGEVKGLGQGTGPSNLHQRLTLESALDLTVLAYARTADGFVTSLHQTAQKWTTDGGSGALVEFFNPGSNRRIASVLRIINLEDRPISVDIHGYDDAMTLNGWIAPRIRVSRHVQLEIAGRGARNLPSWVLEAGPQDATGNLGDGTGKWTLVVHADGDIEVMSLLYNDAGYVTNVSD